MKKILNGILASSLILSMGAVSFAQEIPVETAETEIFQEIETKTLSSMSPEVASAYAGVIENITQKYGENPDKSRGVFETGLCTAQLIDFDKDGIDELYVSYVNDVNITMAPDVIEYASGKYITEEIWGYTDSGLKKLTSVEIDSSGTGSAAISDGSFLLPHEGRDLFVVFNTVGSMSSRADYKIYEIKDGTCSTFETINIQFDTLTGTFTVVLTMNGTKTTETTPENGTVYNTLFSDLMETYTFGRSNENYDLSGKRYLTYVNYDFFWEYQNCLPQLQAIASQPSSKTATPSTAKVMVNGELVNFGAYNIDGFNFYKLTDVSYALNGTGKQFEVTWDGEIGAINMKIGSPHIVLGSELQGTSGTDKIAEEMDVKVLKNSALVNDLIVYSIDGSSYFQLDKLKGVLGIDVGWDGDTSTITITT